MDFGSGFSVVRGKLPRYKAALQSSTLQYLELRRIRPHPRSYWRTCGPELANLASVARRILGALTTSASVERSFSLARAVCADYRLAMKPETVTARVVIRANWETVEPLLVHTLEMTDLGRAEFVRSREHSGRSAWREYVFPEDDE